MRDLPTGLNLLALARRLLLDDIVPLLPEARQRDVRLAATSMAIAAREAAHGDGPMEEVLGLLGGVYPHPPVADAPGPPSPAVRAREKDGESLSRTTAGEGARRAREGVEDGLHILLARFADGLRRGEFETSGSQERAARAILWRMTILKLREGNPQFLAAHGIGEAAGE